MYSETESNTSSSLSLLEQERKRKKLHKKLKTKWENKKKEKKNRKEKKKRSRKDTKSSGEEDDIQIQKAILPQKKLGKNINVIEEIDEAFGPALPSHLLNKNNEVDKIQPPVIGPILPKELLGKLGQSESQNLTEKKPQELLNKLEIEDDNLQGSYGPLPVNNEDELTPTQLELEQRALELKMTAIDGINVSKSKQNVREEWMVELPNVGLKSGLAALNNLKRGFHRGKEKPDFSDRSSWTRTPNSCQEKQKPICSKKELELAALALYEKQRDAEQEAIAKKHRKKHKREESLLEIHQKKLRADEKKKLKELKEIGAKPKRRPFTRDVDLKLNRIDSNQTKQIVDKAKILNTKFASGHSKYL